MQSIPMMEIGPSNAAIAAEAVQVADVVSDTCRKRRELRLPLEFVKPLWMLLDVCTCFAVTAISLSPDLFPGSTAYEQHSPSLIFGMLLGIVLCERSGCYDPAALGRNAFSLRRFLVSWALAALFLVVGGTLPWTKAAPLGWMVGWFAVAFLLIQLIRMAVHRLLRSPAGAIATRRLALVGAAESARTLERMIAGHALGYNVVGTVFCHPRRGVAGSRGNEDFRRLIDLVRSERVDEVIVALPWSAADSIRGIVSALRCVSVDIRLAPEQLPALPATAGYTSIGGTPMFRLADRPLCPWQSMVKTVADTVLAATALALLAPLIVLIAAAISLDSPGPVLFGQTRRGLNGALIRVWKFRTMYHHLRDDDAAQLATRHDPRVTRVGRFLRRSSLDEIPQLFNVLTGGMSIVGPRPHPLSAKAAGRLYAEIVEDYEDRHRVKPGITGWAQVNGWRGETDCVEKIQKRVEFDRFYIQNWSLGLDVRILFMTILAILRGDNAY